MNYLVRKSHLIQFIAWEVFIVLIKTETVETHRTVQITWIKTVRHLQTRHRSKIICQTHQIDSTLSGVIKYI